MKKIKISPKLLYALKVAVPTGLAAGLVRVDSSIYASLNPMLAIIMLAGHKLGKLAGAIVGIVATAVSSIYCGIGPWCIMQFILWTSAGILGGCLKSKASVLQLSVIYGFMFGIVMDIFCFYVTPWLPYATPIDQIIGGLPYDIRYCVVTTGSVATFFVAEYIYKTIKSAIQSKYAHQNS